MTDKIVWQFSTQSDFGAFLIRYGTRSDWSHIDAVFPDGTLLGARSDTATPGVQIRQPGYATFSKTLRVSIATPCADEFYDILKTQIGKPYDWRAIIAFGMGNRDWRSGHAWFCSELQIWALERSGFFEHPIAVRVDRISPGDALLLISPWCDIIG